MDDLLREFLTETSENIAILDIELVKLEQNPNEPALISSIFRLVHTIKGTCGFLGLPRLEKVAHAAENVLGKFRDRELVATPHAVTLILNALDIIKTILAGLEASGAEPEGNDQVTISALNEMASAGEVPSGQELLVMPDFPSFEPEAEPAIEVDAVQPLRSVQAPPSVAPVTTQKEAPVSSQTIRVNVELLENLMTTVSELVLTRNQLLQLLRKQKETDFAVPLQRLNQVVSELQEDVMRTRMQPISSAWAKLPRLIRDLSQDLNKKIELEMRGSETELDRQVLELIKDPLTHMVRNCADHGIENPEARVAAGKPEMGYIQLNAYHQGGYIIIEIADDGRGLNMDRIRQKVIANNLATEAELAAMSEAQIQQFIFRAGFSTAEAITSVSGRGVGMDVVKTNIEKIGGTVELRSVAGSGSTFSIKIPLTLAIVSALIVEVGTERYAIPQIAVTELVRASDLASAGSHRIEYISDAPVLRLRDKLLPLIMLGDVLKLDRRADGGDERFIVVTQVEGQTFGIVVDRVFDTEEIVVKPVAPIVRSLSIFSGNTILGDGSVIMILDPKDVATTAGEHVTRSVDSTADVRHGANDVTAAREMLLVFKAGGKTPKAVPLSLLARLEELDSASIESAQGAYAVQYRGHLMPLAAIGKSSDGPRQGRQPVLVFSEGDRSVGLMVDEIVDIVEASLEIELHSAGEGLLGSTILAGIATDLIDVEFYFRSLFDALVNRRVA
jgi:two-component system chemotaxis sensor kinase CheA